MTKQLAVQRYATALLVRLRRLARNEPAALDDDLDEDDDELTTDPPDRSFPSHCPPTSRA